MTRCPSATRRLLASLGLAEADEDAFGTVTRAYHLPSGTGEEQAARSGAMARAVRELAWPAAQVISVAKIVIDLAEALAAISNQNMISEVAAAAEAARASAATARVGIEVNLAGITDEQASLEMIADLGEVDGIVSRAETLTAAICERIRG